jgi:hypothetical protein
MKSIMTLIPAYKPEFLGDVFAGLLRQDCRDFQVVLSDDSPDQRITSLLEKGRWGNVPERLGLEVLPGPGNARLNQRALIDYWDGRTPFVHMHLDDDYIYPSFYRHHLEAHASGRYSVTVSRRWMSRLDLTPTQGFALPPFVDKSATRNVAIDEQTLFQSMVPRCDNWLGEFSNMLISKVGAKAWPLPRTDGSNYFGWPDVGFLLEAVQHAPVLIVKEYLSVFRGHPEQSTHKPNNHSGRVSWLAWLTYALHAWREGRITQEQAVEAIILGARKCLVTFGVNDPIINQFLEVLQNEGFDLRRLNDAYQPIWAGLLLSDRSTAAGSMPNAFGSGRSVGIN